MFQYLHNLSKSYGYWEMPPFLHQQGRRVSKELLSIMVSPPIRGKVVTLFDGDLADKTWLPSPLVKQNWLHQVKLFSKERTPQLWYQRWSMRVVTLKCPATMQQHSIWSGMDQRQHGEPVTSMLRHYGYIKCRGEGSSSHINLPAQGLSGECRETAASLLLIVESSLPALPPAVPGQLPQHYPAALPPSSPIFPDSPPSSLRSNSGEFGLGGSSGWPAQSQSEGQTVGQKQVKCCEVIIWSK